MNPSNQKTKLERQRMAFLFRVLSPNARRRVLRTAALGNIQTKKVSA